VGMATSGLVIAGLSEAGGVPPSTVERMLRVHRRARLAPEGRPGRGTSVGAFTPFHLTCVLLGFAGAQHSDAAEAAETLRKFEWYHSYPPQKNSLTPPKFFQTARIPGTLGEVIEALIAGGFGLPQEKPDVIHNWYVPDLVLSLGPPEALVKWPDGKGDYELIEKYGPVKGVEYTFNNGGIQRLTLVKGVMIDVAAALWRDTPKNKDADPPARGPAPLTTVKHKADRALNTSEPTARRSFFPNPKRKSDR
jgi:hypothetical protein